MAFYLILIFSAFTGNVITSGIYGSIGKVPASGASCRTAKQDKLPYCYNQASAKMAEADLAKMNKYKPKILSVARKKQMDSSVIAGIISRETRVGSTLKNGWGNNNNGFGLMQVDKKSHTPKGTWDSETHISQGTDILISMYNKLKKKNPKASNEKLLKGAIAAYNAGASRITNLDDVDRKTTGGDYANDVIERSKFFKKHGY